jgi:signal transduction histidine kinase
VTFRDVTQLKEAQESLAAKIDELARANAEAQARAHEQEALNSVAKAIHQSLHRDELMEIALRKVQEVTGRDRVSIRLKDVVTGEVKLVAHRGFSQQEVEQLLKILQHKATERVMATGQPLVVDNAQDQDVSSILLLPQSRSVAWIPIKAGTQIMGILGLSAGNPIPFSRREVDFLQSIASMIGAALENARLYKQAQDSKKELEVINQRLERLLQDQSGLYAALTPLAPADTANQMLERVIERLIEATGADAGLVRLRAKATGEIICAAQKGFPDHYLELTQSKSTASAYGQVLRSGNPVIAADIAADDRIKAKVQLELGFHSCAFLPLKVHDETRGVILLSSRELGHFNVEQETYLMAIARQMGIAMENRELFDELEESKAELARSNSELQHFAYIASHDLQEPLRMVTSYVQLLARRCQDKLDSDAHEFIAFAVDGAMRMQALIKALLDYSRIGTKIKPFEPTDLEAVVQTALKNLQVAVAESEAIVTYDTLPMVMGDATQLGQLFQNLIGNAIKFRGDAPPRIHISAERNGRDWYFSCRDNGIGIDPRFSERIFVIFQRLHSKEEYSGTGIGLALCKKIVERHGGRIWVESEPGKGATFRFTIPQELFSFFKETPAFSA